MQNTGFFDFVLISPKRGYLRERGIPESVGHLLLHLCIPHACAVINGYLAQHVSGITGSLTSNCHKHTRSKTRFAHCHRKRQNQPSVFPQKSTQ